MVLALPMHPNLKEGELKQMGDVILGGVHRFQSDIPLLLLRLTVITRTFGYSWCQRSVPEVPLCLNSGINNAKLVSA